MQDFQWQNALITNFSERLQGIAQRFRQGNPFGRGVGGAFGLNEQGLVDQAQRLQTRIDTLQQSISPAGAMARQTAGRPALSEEEIANRQGTIRNLRGQRDVASARLSTFAGGGQGQGAGGLRAAGSALRGIVASLASAAPLIGVVAAGIAALAVTLAGIGRVRALDRITSSFVVGADSIDEARANLRGFSNTLRGDTLRALNQTSATTRLIFTRGLTQDQRDFVNQYAIRISEISGLTKEAAIELLTLGSNGQLTQQQFTLLASELGLSNTELENFIETGGGIQGIIPHVDMVRDSQSGLARAMSDLNTVWQTFTTQLFENEGSCDYTFSRAGHTRGGR